MSVGAGAPSPRGRFVDIGGRRLRIVEAGPRGSGPTVVLEAGAFGFSADWAEVQARLAAKGVRSVAYDRAGMAYSDPGPAPRDGVAVAEDLEKLLAAAEEPGPHVLVGHSMAGVRIWLLGQRLRPSILGLVFVDAATPDIISSERSQPLLNSFGALSRAAAGAAAVGLLKPFSFGADTIGLPPDAAAEKRWAFADPRHNRTAADEVVLWEIAAEQASAAAPRLDPKLPVAVITAGKGSGGALWRDLYAEPARLAERGYFVEVAEAHHADLLGFRFADEIIKGIDFIRGAESQEQAA